MWLYPHSPRGSCKPPRSRLKCPPPRRHANDVVSPALEDSFRLHVWGPWADACAQQLSRLPWDVVALVSGNIIELFTTL